MLPINDITSVELLITIAIIIVLSLLLAEMCDWTQMFFDGNSYNYSYHDPCGPSLWKEKFPQSKGKFQSPINIALACVITVPVETRPPLLFSPEYTMLPKDLCLHNDGHSVILYATFCSNLRPTVTGGPLDETYQFCNARFRWGSNDEEGSEHTIENVRYAMELQVVHVKVGRPYMNIKDAAEDNAILIISYLYQISPVENIYFEPIINALPKIKHPYNYVNIEPAPLSFFIPPFVCKYVMYCGSLSYPPCTEGVSWIIQPEPLGISSRQVRKFRKICAIDGPIDVNARPIQEINNRQVFFYD